MVFHYIQIIYKTKQTEQDASPESRASPRATPRAAPSVEAHYCVNGLDTGRNHGGRRIEKIF